MTVQRSGPRQFSDTEAWTSYEAHAETKTYKTSDMLALQSAAHPSDWYNHDDECTRYRLVAIQWENKTTQVACITESYPMKTIHGHYHVWRLAGPSGPGAIKVGQQCRGGGLQNQVYVWDFSNPKKYVKRVALSVSFGPLTTREADDHHVWAAWQKRWQS